MRETADSKEECQVHYVDKEEKGDRSRKSGLDFQLASFRAGAMCFLNLLDGCSYMALSFSQFDADDHVQCQAIASIVFRL